ncbi:hypothetical protein [Pseudorhodoferax sp. Leaf267]|uniref:hypothetical protein n=1 Tax=Pseudorhodoferax sp. Leaf267 TaxID=1736316 RepID=UPI0012E2B534|nr:hypothetical protein [Pseudorhodoferax sp. Leaf267]
MSELIVVMVGGVAAFMLWRGLRNRAQQPDFQVAGSSFGSVSSPVPLDTHQWPHLGRFDFEVLSGPRHQPALRHALEQLGEHCVATLRAGDGAEHNIGAPVEVLVEDVRVGYLLDGDATRFHRRLAYEGRPGQLSQCDARITVDDATRRVDKRTYAILLDLKPFRH